MPTKFGLKNTSSRPSRPLVTPSNPLIISVLTTLGSILISCCIWRFSIRLIRVREPRRGMFQWPFQALVSPGQYVLELAFAEYFLQRYPRESPGPLRERVNALIGKRNLPKWIKAASLQNLVFPYDDIDKLKRHDKEPPVRSVFWALFGTIYLCFGMPEVYRVLFEVIGMDPEDDYCQPKLRRHLDDVDVVSVEFEEQLSWLEVAAYKVWPQLMEILGYPLQMIDNIPEITEARNIELGLGLQLCFLHPSKYKSEHPRFCFDRLEYLGQKIQDLVMAERLLIKYIGAPGKWLQEKHGRLLLNKLWALSEEKHLQRFIIYGENVENKYEHNRRLKNPSTTSVQQAIHGLSYCVYGKPDVRRLMF
ncbi:hypothetical protein HPP92_016990 [Vanilla planifolia]|uniref:RNase III domain-containing protein n=1 Tax=Vanilla planifolia TaxID=51239 RepID=A0A835QH49_VANPL|nr:hypothetical protein HPP92_016990 [Vanilla planifolia]